MPALAIPSDDTDPTTNSAIAARELEISDANVAIPELDYSHLPHCPACKTGLLRPGVVWFGEKPYHLDEINLLVFKADLCIVIGTSSIVSTRLF